MGMSQAEDEIMEDYEQRSQIERYADKAMFPAAPMESVTPKVHLLWMTPDPLGAVAAAAMMYEGIPIHSLAEVGDDHRFHYWEESQKTKLKAPWEYVKFHFMIEGVTRAFTHQHVRQRTAVYSQESLRFAVKDNLAQEVRYPPSLVDDGLSPSERNIRQKGWDDTVEAIERGYRALIANGVPAEDARGLLPTAVTTRLHYCTDLRNLIEHAGNRLCTQAQYEWKEVFMGQEGIIEAIRNYTPDWSWFGDLPLYTMEGVSGRDIMSKWEDKFRWQFHKITDDLFVPACYQAGHCPFKADFDRGCTIRGRVDMFARNGIPSKDWGDKAKVTNGIPIQREEWLADPKAAWVK